jgi:YEATS domain-containing protein 4
VKQLFVRLLLFLSASLPGLSVLVGSDSSVIMKGTTIVKQIVYGNVAKYFGKKREEDGHTHNWTVYVKPYANEDIGSYVKKVHFKLHDSYTNQNRVLTKAPFEVSETGWGEFEITIKLHFVDPNEKPVTIYHMLRLFETDPISKTISIKKNLVSEFYDEIIFQDPSPLLAHALNSNKNTSQAAFRHETDFEERRERTLNSIVQAKRKVRNEIGELRERLKQAQKTIGRYKEEIVKMEAVGVPSSVADRPEEESQTDVILPIK